MKRHSMIVIGMTVLGLGLAWFFLTHERVETKVWVGPSREARDNPYLAAMRFVERFDRQAALVDKIATLDKLASEAAPATVMLLAGRVAVTPDRARALLRWAEAGAHLIIEPESGATRDALIDPLGVQRRDVTITNAASTVTVTAPGLERSIVISAIGMTVLDAANIYPDLVITDPAGVRIASARRGAGRITIVAGMTRFRNNLIGTHDNAEFLKGLVELPPALGSFHLFRPAREQALWTWIKAYALAPISIGIALVLLWFWRVSPRFGPPRPLVLTERRQLVEHILACGRFRWKRGARAELLAAAREQSMADLNTHHPRLAWVNAQERYRAIAGMLGASLTVIQHAYEVNPARGRDFVQAVATIARLQACLKRSATRTAPRNPR